MPKERCSVCGRLARCVPTATNTTEYEVTFASDVCPGCCVTLSRALEGIVELLREAHGENSQRVLLKLMERLNVQGFDVSRFTRRSA
jgi:hypothetical protein